MKVSDLGTRLTQAMAWRGMNGDDLARASVIDLTFNKYRNSM